jgi:hypothetical protein
MLCVPQASKSPPALVHQAWGIQGGEGDPYRRPLIRLRLRDAGGGPVGNLLGRPAGPPRRRFAQPPDRLVGFGSGSLRVASSNGSGVGGRGGASLSFDLLLIVAPIWLGQHPQPASEIYQEQ